MGGDVDSVTLSEEAKELNITLGDGADTFTDTASNPQQGHGWWPGRR